MDRVELLAYYRMMAERCGARAEAMADARDARLHRAFADQFAQYAKAAEDEERQKAG